MNCFTLYWNKLGILTWSVSWAADNEQLRDTNNLNQYSCLKGMGMTISQNLLYPCETDKYANRYTPPTPRFLNYPCVVRCSHKGSRTDLRAVTRVFLYCTHFSASISPLGVGSSTRQVPCLAELPPASSSWQTLHFCLQTAVKLILLLSINRLHLQINK